MKSRLSTLCRQCGNCCKCMVLPVVKPLQKSVLEGWLSARGCEIVREDNDGTVYVKVDFPCPHLTKSDNGWACDDYENRPAGCRLFDGTSYDFLDCKWKDIEKNVIIKGRE